MDILPDVLQPNLRIVFCGMAAGNRSAKLSAYYAGIGNKFWKILYDSGLTSTLMSPREYRFIVNHNLGLTDLVKNSCGNDSAITPTSEDIEILRDKILLYRPKILAFTGKQSAKCFLGRNVEYGLQGERVGLTRICVLPSTSTQAMHYWNEKYWHELARNSWGSTV